MTREQDRILKPGDEIYISFNPFMLESEKVPAQLLYEGEDFLDLDVGTHIRVRKSAIYSISKEIWERKLIPAQYSRDDCCG